MIRLTYACLFIIIIIIIIIFIIIIIAISYMYTNIYYLTTSTVRLRYITSQLTAICININNNNI